MEYFTSLLLSPSKRWKRCIWSPPSWETSVWSDHYGMGKCVSRPIWPLRTHFMIQCVGYLFHSSFWPFIESRNGGRRNILKRGCVNIFSFERGILAKGRWHPIPRLRGGEVIICTSLHPKWVPILAKTIHFIVKLCWIRCTGERKWNAFWFWTVLGF